MCAAEHVMLAHHSRGTTAFASGHPSHATNASATDIVGTMDLHGHSGNDLAKLSLQSL